MKSYIIFLISLLLIPTSVTKGEPEVSAVKAGKILTISGSPIEDGVILIKNGKIKFTSR